MEDGPSELGGLVLDAAHRGTPEKLGKTLSYVRFGYIAARRDRFRPRLLAEMAAPIASDGTNHLWEAIGRPFTLTSMTLRAVPVSRMSGSVMMTPGRGVSISICGPRKMPRASTSA